MSEMSPAEEVFFAALEQPSAAGRDAYLDAACAGRPELRARVEKLLAAHPRVGGFLESGVPGEATATYGAGEPAASGTYRPDAESAGTVVAGRYKLLQQIGEGGMGTVWMADQTEPVKRRVAVKLIRVERGQSRTILARFEAERQAIALMDHPHIAKLLDAGTTDTGAPYFVMELVKGVPLTDFCDAHKLGIPERLNLFMQICSAVQHAHQKGIIHRDLKPSNILVESHDGKPVPKVIDFGLAKATTGLQLSDHTLFTAFGSVMGTPLYMAPEQANFNAVDVDTRADVYALGVILYELLTGTTPLTRETVKKAALDEMLKLVREQEAPTPSSRLSSAESAPGAAANRQTEPAKLGRLVKGELDWIVLKALSKERDRRYETASGFARDVERFLAHEPVTAGPPGATYRLRKFVRRNRPQVVAASLVLLALVAGVVGTTAGLIEASRQERVAVAAQSAEAERAEGERLARVDAQANEKLAGDRLVQVEAEKKTAVEEKARAEQEQQIAQAVKDFLQTKLLAQADTTAQADQLLRAGGMAAEAKFNPTIRELLDRAAKELAPDKIEANFPKQPLVQAEILRTVGRAYRGIGEAAAGIPFLARSVDLYKVKLGLDQQDTLSSMNDLALVYLEAGQRDRALPLYEETLKLQKAKFGPDHPDTLVSMNNLANGYYFDGKLDLALPLYEETLTRRKAKLGPDHPYTLVSMNNLANGYRDARKLDLALPLAEETLKLRKARLGPDHPGTLHSMNTLAMVYKDADKSDKALPLLEESLKLRKAKVGPDHPDTLINMNNLAACYRSMKRLDQSVPLLEEVLLLQEKKLGRGHPETLTTVAGLGVQYNDAGRVAEALPLLEEAYRASEKYPILQWVGPHLLVAYLKAGKPVDAAKLGVEVLAYTRKTLPNDSPQLAGHLAHYCQALLEMKSFTEAEPLLRECLAIREAKEPDNWTTFNTHSLLGGALLGQKKYAEAEPLLLKGYEGMKQREKTIPPPAAARIPEALDRLIELSAATNKPDTMKKDQELRAKYPSPQEVAPPPREKK